jgi:glycosyltransferase involved in cell wall biosynthesis
MASEPLVSVIIPTYNRGALIGRAIDSVRAQTYPNIEIIVVDDGSTDDTQDRLRQYGDGVRVVSQENAGPAAARNKGIAQARGEYIAFLDSDDYWLQGKLARQIEALEKAGSSVPCCLCNCTVLYPDGSKTSTFKIADIVPNYPDGLWLNPEMVLSTRFVLFNQAAAIRRKALQRVGGFDEKLRLLEDYDLGLRLALEGPWTIVRDEMVVYNDASHGSLASTARQNELPLREYQLRVREHIFALIHCQPRHFRLRRLARRELRRARRELIVARLTSRKGLRASALGQTLRFAERLRQGIFRRSPLFPSVIVQPFSESTSKLPSNGAP